ncbi:MAG: PEP-utilizing enzyme, partial [bacterium]|nr:PEP-utilizing enzyme [bacterium]
MPEGNLYAIYFARDEFQRLIANFRRFLFRCDLAAYARRYESEFRKFLRWSRSVHRRNLRALSRDDFARLFSELSRRLVDFAELQFLAFVVLEGPGRELEELMSHQPDGQDLLQVVATPYRETKITRARTELMRLAAAGRPTSRRLSAYVQRYAWLPVYEFIDLPLRVADIQDQIRQMNDPMPELRRYRRQRRENLHRYRKLLASIRKPRVRRLVQIMHSWAYLKEMRDDYRRHAYYLLIPFWHELARRVGLPFIQTNYLTTDELLDILTTGRVPDQKRIAARQRRYAISLRQGRLHVYSGARAGQLMRLVASPSTGAVVRGVPACSGRANGRVKVIFHRGEFKKFKSGEVLVTTMTHPEFVLVMRRASAVVTDEGGMTCHAAIVSRELNIPCIEGIGGSLLYLV